MRFDDGSVMRLYKQTVQDFGLYPGLELTDEEISRLKTAAGQMSAKMRAVRIVSASSVSKWDLEQRLIHKGEDPEQAKAAVEWMSDLSLLDDRKTAEQVVQRCISKGYGISRAKQALYEKRIPKEYWEEALAEYPDQTDKIVEFLRSRLNEAYEERDVRRATDALLRRGKFWYLHGADDNHNTVPLEDPLSDSFGSWTMIIAPKLDYPSVIAALEQGRFYASTGPDIRELSIHDGKVYIETSPAVRITMHMSPKYCKNIWNPDGSEFSSAEFDIPADAPYVYFTIWDKHGKKAHTRAFSREEFSG